MKSIFNKAFAFMVIAAMTIGFVGCKSNTEEETDDAAAAAVATQFVDKTVAPTYTALATYAEQLATQLTALKEATTRTDAAVTEACNTFLAAREQWEKSEAFLFGAAADYGVDPHIDSWPLDEDAFATLMASPAMLEALDAEDGDAVAGERLGNALLGFHGIEYILFANGQPKSASAISDNQWIYVAAVAGDLRNRCYQLEVAWVGDAAPASHIEKLDDLEMAYTVSSSELSYGDNMKNAGQAGSLYASRTAALMEMIQGCIDIADEVGTSKIGAAYSGEDVTYIESPYSQKSIVDFTNNILSIQNSYMGGIEGQRDNSKSMHKYINDLDASLDAKVIAAINNALEKIAAMPAPFVNNYSNSANGEAIEACTELSETLDEVVTALRNK